MPGASKKLIVVGAGHAGTELAFRARAGGFSGSIELIGAEPHHPYQRPPLSKSVLAHPDAAVDELILRDPEAYAAARINLRHGARVARINRASRTVTLRSGEALPYTWLALATGGQARRLELPGHRLDGVHLLRTLGDAEALRASLRAGARLVVVGAGYIGLEVAAVAVQLGLDVTVVEAAPRVLARVAGPALSAFVEAWHAKTGVKFHLGRSVEAFVATPHREGHVGAVHCVGGLTLPADLVLVAAGLVPETSLAQAAGLAIGNGVWVDAFCRTDDPGIFALGDNAAFPLPGWGERIRLESVPNACEHARVAASVINGAPSPYGATPWFWSDQGALRLQSVGVAHAGDEEIQRPVPGGYAAFFRREGHVVAAECVNAPAVFNAAKKLVAARLPISAARLSDPGQSLKLPPSPETSLKLTLTVDHV